MISIFEISIWSGFVDYHKGSLNSKFLWSLSSSSSSGWLERRNNELDAHKRSIICLEETWLAPKK